MRQHFGSALARPWALVKWNAGSTPGRRPATTIAYITDDCGDHYLGGLVEFHRKHAALKVVRDSAGKTVRYDVAVPGDPYPRWHFRFSRPRKFERDAIVLFFPNGKSREDGPTASQIKAAKKHVAKNPIEQEAA